MKDFVIWGIASAFAAVSGSCGGGTSELPRDEVALFSSSDRRLEEAFAWAKDTALSYVHDGGDPVGLWYEAALPRREAFCMRDAAHQSVGAQILGLARHNKNMFSRFAENISEGRDWCTYWEINRYDRPAPEDYASDDAFWYNLDANFDVVQAWWKMYEWTGDGDYVASEPFVRFRRITAHEYTERWMLEPHNVMKRPRYVNSPADFDPDYSFHVCRGLPSYVENFAGMTMSLDLLSAMYAGFSACARMADIEGDAAEAERARAAAAAYRRIIDEEWWDDENGRYHTFHAEDGTFHRGEGVPFVLWFGAAEENRTAAAVDDILCREWNVENMSAFPALFYRLGRFDEAYRFLTGLRHVARCEYPEVSFGVTEGVVCGAMGIEPSFAEGRITTCQRLAADTSTEIRNLPVFGGYVSVRHGSGTESSMENRTGRDVEWEASFVGDYGTITVDGERHAAEKRRDASGNTVSFVRTHLPDGPTARRPRPMRNERPCRLT